MKKLIIALFIIIVVLAVVSVIVAFSSPKSVKTLTLEDKCIASGGEVVETLCCGMTADFPNSCAIGGCGCAPEFSKNTKTCVCGEGKCFDGEKCTAFNY